MCSFMIDFIKKLKTGLYMREMMNIVLEHLGVLQVSASFICSHKILTYCF